MNVPIKRGLHKGCYSVGEIQGLHEDFLVRGWGCHCSSSTFTSGVGCDSHRASLFRSWEGLRRQPAILSGHLCVALGVTSSPPNLRSSLLPILFKIVTKSMSIKSAAMPSFILCHLGFILDGAAMDQEKWWLEYDPPKANYKSGFGRGPFGVALRSVQRLSLTCEIILASLRLFGVI